MRSTRSQRWQRAVRAAAGLTLAGFFHGPGLAAQSVGAVYVMTNAVEANEIVVFGRDAQGRLSDSDRVPTGGRGSGGEIDPLGSQGALILSHDRLRLFAVNAGSNEISAFAVEGDTLVRTSLVRSRGRLPVSLTQHADLVYVLNAGGRPSIHGFELREDGRLVRLSRSRRLLESDVAPSGRAEAPAQLGFTPDGAWLVLTDIATDEIHMWQIDDEGRPSATATLWPSIGAGPFGFDFDPRGHLLVSELWGRNPNGTELAGAASSYAIRPGGTLELVSRSVENGEVATCWLLSDGRRSAFTTNTASSTLSRYRVRRNGRLRLRGGPVRAAGGSEALPTDLAITADGSFLYTLNAGRGTVGMFRVSGSGRLVVLGEAGALPPRSGLQGIAAR